MHPTAVCGNVLIHDGGPAYWADLYRRHAIKLTQRFGRHRIVRAVVLATGCTARHEPGKSDRFPDGRWLHAYNVGNALPES